MKNNISEFDVKDVTYGQFAKSLALLVWHFIVMVTIFLLEIVKAPFRALGALMRFFIGVGQGSIRFVLNTILFLMGLGLVGMLVIGFGRVLFYPLFH